MALQRKAMASWSNTIMRFLFLCFCFLCNVHVNADAHVCSSDERASDLAKCLMKVVEAANDTSRFWFGDQYTSMCPGGKPTIPDCYVLPDFPKKPTTLLKMAFGTYSVNTSTIDRFINVAYTSPPGSYSGCGHTWKVDTQKEFTLDPINDTVYNAWEARQKPSISWTSSSDELFSLFIMDLGIGLMHGVYINIRDTTGDISKSDVMSEYNGPKNPRRRANVYAFLVFKQAHHLKLSTEWNAKLSTRRFNYTMESVIKELNFTGLVGMNWLQARGDGYSVQYLLDSGTINNCPMLYTNALKANHPTNLLVVGNFELQYTMNVLFSLGKFTFESCCDVVKRPTTQFSPNLLGNDIINCADVRGNADPKIGLKRRGYIPPRPGYNYVSNDTLYTLLMVDFNENAKFILHWMIINAPADNINAGEHVVPYSEPLPRSDSIQTYYFLLYEQTERKNSTQMANKIKLNCTSSLNGRCTFSQINFLLIEKNTFVGASWIRAKNDAFVRYKLIQRGENATSVCKGVSGYEDPCPVGRGGIMTSSLITILIFASFVTVILKMSV